MSSFLAASLALALAFSPSGDDDWTIRAATVHTVSGKPIEDGVVRVEGGKIAAVGKGGGGSEVLECAAVTPGLIDLSLGVDTGQLSVEQSSETAARLRVAEGLDLFSHRWERALCSGITTALAAPADNDVIGGLGLALKTGGEPTLAARLVQADAFVRGAIGPQPSWGNSIPRFQEPQNFYFRRPTTRMGVEWVFRKAFYDTLQAQGEADPAAAADHAVLRRVLSGELPLVVQAKATQDVRTAIYLKEEFGIPRMVLDHAIEAWREPELLKRSGVAVVLPPFSPDGRHSDGFVNDSYFLPLDAAARLHEWGVPFALSGHDGPRPGARLADQAALAQRGGLSFEAALAAVTLVPARLAGVEKRVGSLEVGKDADLVLWNGPPLQPSSRIIGVLLQGKLVVDPRSK